MAMATGSSLSGSSQEISYYTRQEVSLHDNRDDCWIIVHGRVYDVTEWLVRHPGGKDIILHRAGEDVTVPFEMFHFDQNNVSKYLKSYYKGELVENEKPLKVIEKDVLDLRDKLIQKGLFESKLSFYVIQFIAGLLFELIAIAILCIFNDSWTSWTTAIFCLFLSTATMQGLGHDLGHRSAFSTVYYNNLALNISYTFFGGVSSYYWKKHHNEHHSKTSIQTKDPDVSYKPYFFLLGSYYPKEMGKKRQGILPYQIQGFYIIGMFSLAISLYVNGKGIALICKNIKKKWKDGIWFAAFLIRWYVIYSTFFGGFWGALVSLFVVKGLHGMWYITVARAHHDSRPIGIYDGKQDWLTLQVEHTCNLTSTWFCDIFTSHTNYQIEHHLFPSMPPHNHHLVQPYVKELCTKHNLQYHERSLWEALVDVPREFNKCGREWYHEYTRATAELQKNQ